MINKSLQKTLFLFSLLSLSFLLSFLASSCERVDAPSDGSVEERPALDRVMLVDHHAWQLTREEEDPYLARRPDRVVCTPEEGYRFEILNEEPAFQIHTSFCNYITVEQPLKIPLYRGDLLHLRMWHFSLTSFEATEAFAAIRMGEKEIWSARIPLPARSNLFYPDILLEHDLPATSLLRFHLNNHGANTWHLIELSASRELAKR